MVSPVVHFQFASRDPAQTIAFFRAVFDWEIDDQSPGVAANITTGWADDIVVGGTVIKAPTGRADYATVYVRVDDLPATLAKTRANGGAVIRDATLTPGGVTIAVIETPGGAVLGLVQQ